MVIIVLNIVVLIKISDYNVQQKSKRSENDYLAIIWNIFRLILKVKHAICKMVLIYRFVEII